MTTQPKMTQQETQVPVFEHRETLMNTIMKTHGRLLEAGFEPQRQFYQLNWEHNPVLDSYDIFFKKVAVTPDGAPILAEYVKIVKDDAGDLVAFTVNYLVLIFEAFMDDVMEELATLEVGQDIGFRFRLRDDDTMFCVLQHQAPDTV